MQRPYAEVSLQDPAGPGKRAPVGLDAFNAQKQRSTPAEQRSAATLAVEGRHLQCERESGENRVHMNPEVTARRPAPGASQAPPTQGSTPAAQPATGGAASPQVNPPVPAPKNRTHRPQAPSHQCKSRPNRSRPPLRLRRPHPPHRQKRPHPALKRRPRISSRRLNRFRHPQPQPQPSRMRKRHRRRARQRVSDPQVFRTAAVALLRWGGRR